MAVKSAGRVLPVDLVADADVADFLNIVLPSAHAGGSPAAALVPWICERLPSPHSRRAYLSDLADYLSHMRNKGIDPLSVTGDALLSAGGQIPLGGRNEKQPF